MSIRRKELRHHLNTEEKALLKSKSSGSSGIESISRSRSETDAFNSLFADTKAPLSYCKNHPVAFPYKKTTVST